MHRNRVAAMGLLPLALFIPLALGSGPTTVGHDEPVTLASLLEELVDASRLAELPEHAFRTRSLGGAVAAETGESEQELAQLEGPGALVTVFVSPPAGRLRVHVDGGEEPALELELDAEPGGELWGLYEVAGDVGALRLPVPYAGSCRLIWAPPHPSDGATDNGATELRFLVEQRVFDPGTPVESLSAERLAREGELARTAARRLAEPFEQAAGPRTVGEEDEQDSPGEVTHPFGHRIASTGKDGAAVYAGLSNATGGMSSAVTELRLVARDADPSDRSDLEQLLNDALLILTFDGRETVRMPLSAFFAWPTAPFESRLLSVRGGAEGVLLVARFPMPYRETLFVRVESGRPEPLDLMGYATIAPFEFTPRTLYFHAAHRERELAPAGALVWRPLEVLSRGQLVGVASSLFERVPGDQDSAGPGMRALSQFAGPSFRIAADGEPSEPQGRLADWFGSAPHARRFARPLLGVTATGESGRWSRFRMLAADRIPFLARLEVDAASPTRTEDDPPGDRTECVLWFYADLPAEGGGERLEAAGR